MSGVASNFAAVTRSLARTMVIAVSQSGETADTLAALRKAKSQGSPVCSVVNVLDSSIARESDWVLYTHAGPEIGVASTKAFITQVTTDSGYSLGCAPAGAKHRLSLSATR